MIRTFLVFRNSPAGLGGQNLKRAVAEIATVELEFCLCNPKCNNNVYTFVDGWMQRF